MGHTTGRGGWIQGRLGMLRIKINYMHVQSSHLVKKHILGTWQRESYIKSGVKTEAGRSEFILPKSKESQKLQKLRGEKPDIPLETLNEAHPCMHLDCSVVVLISSLWEI